MASRRRNKHRVQIYTASEEPRPSADLVPTLSNVGRNTRRLDTVITKSNVMLDNDPTPPNDHLPEPDNNPEQGQAKPLEPGGIIVSVKPKAKRNQNSVSASFLQHSTLQYFSISGRASVDVVTRISAAIS